MYQQVPRALLALLLSGLLVVAGSAEEVRWRHDYAAAREEAEQQHRPLVLVCTTAHCFWCQKLEALTFREPAIARQLNAQFVPLRVDPQQEPELIRALGVQRYPTLIFAAPDGRILGCHEGFVEAERFRQQLERALRESAPASSRSAPARPAAPTPSAPTLAGGTASPLVRTTAPPAHPLFGVWLQAPHDE